MRFVRAPLNHVSNWFDVETVPGRRRVLAILLAASGVLTALGVVYGVSRFTSGTLVPPLVIGGLLLSPAQLRLLILAAFIEVGVLIAFDGVDDVRLLNVVVIALVGLIVDSVAADRQRLGLSVGRGESMLLELRDSLERNGLPPDLPRPWMAEVARAPAGGGQFGGDFLVTGLTHDGTVLEIALVDVSGKGVTAGTRSLQLSGAFGALLGSVPPDEFLAAANRYVLRQNWAEGFATCLHLAVWLQTGEFTVGCAGHPPAAHFSGGSGRWSLVECEGTALGLYDGAPFGSTTGALGTNDAILLYTDGLVEVPGRDLDVGIDRLLGLTERMLSQGLVGGAAELIKASPSGVNDDRAVVLLWRTS